MAGQVDKRGWNDERSDALFTTSNRRVRFLELLGLLQNRIGERLR